MAGLLEMLLAEPSAADQLLSVLPFLQGASDPQASGGFDLGTSADADNPWGIDVSGNIITRHGDVTLDADAMASLRQAAHATGIKPWQFIGGTYRSIADSNDLYNARHDAHGNLLPGVLPAAAGGHSMHNFGLAFDQSRVLPEILRRWLLNHGWYNGASFGDPPHWSYGRQG